MNVKNVQKLNSRLQARIPVWNDPESCHLSGIAPDLTACAEGKKFDTILDFCVSSLRRGHANLLCIVPILTDDLRRGSMRCVSSCYYISVIFFRTAVASFCLCRDFVGFPGQVRGWI
jgi:hypothetical protein